MEKSYDCQSCGACCYSPFSGEAYVYLNDIDLERLHAHRLPVIQQPQTYCDPPELIPKLGVRMDLHERRVCVAFVGDVGQPCACSIYGDRPTVCRTFEANSNPCREARQRMGLPTATGHGDDSDCQRS